MRCTAWVRDGRAGTPQRELPTTEPTPTQPAKIGIYPRRRNVKRRPARRCCVTTPEPSDSVWRDGIAPWVASGRSRTGADLGIRCGRLRKHRCPEGQARLPEHRRPPDTSDRDAASSIPATAVVRGPGLGAGVADDSRALRWIQSACSGYPSQSGPDRRRRTCDHGRPRARTDGQHRTPMANPDRAAYRHGRTRCWRSVRVRRGSAQAL